MFEEAIYSNAGKNTITVPPLDHQNPYQNNEIYELHLFREAFETEEIEGLLIYPILKKIIKQYNPSAEQIGTLFHGEYLIPEGRLPIFILSFQLVFAGNLYAAVHILSVQMEHLFRMVAKQVGDVTYRIDDKSSGENEISLSGIFELPKLSECLDDRILFTFKGLLSEKAGANLRNRIAHGLMEPNEVEHGIVVYFICAVLKLLIGNF